MTSPVRTVKCPACGKAVAWDARNRFRPFCSERCKQIDLGAWAAEAYRVPSAPPESEEDIDQTSPLSAPDRRHT